MTRAPSYNPRHISQGGFHLLFRVALAAWLALSCAAGAAAPAELVIQVEDAADPFSREDGSGYANEVVRAAFEAAGVRLRLEVVPYARCKLNVLDGRVAGCFSMSWDPAFAGRVVFGERPLFSVHALLVDDPGRPLAAHRPADIAPGTVLGIVNGYEYPAAVTALAQRGVVFETTASDEVNLRKLAAHRLDGAVLMVSTRAWERPEAGTLKGGGRYRTLMTLGTVGSYLGFSERNPHGAYARERFNEGMRLIAANGRLAAIEQRWRDRLKGSARSTR